MEGEEATAGVGESSATATNGSSSTAIPFTTVATVDWPPSSYFATVGNSCSDLPPAYDGQPKAGVAGFTNLGNTCFLNSGLQCLLSNRRLVSYFLKASQHDENQIVEESLLENAGNAPAAPIEDSSSSQVDVTTSEGETGNFALWMPPPAPPLSTSSLSSCFVTLLKQVWNGTRLDQELKPCEFKEALGQCHPQFRDYRQHDCQE